MADPYIRARGVTKTYRSGASDLVVFENLNLDVECGEIRSGPVQCVIVCLRWQTPTSVRAESPRPIGRAPATWWCSKTSTWTWSAVKCWPWWGNRARESPLCCIFWAVWTVLPGVRYTTEVER